MKKIMKGFWTMIQICMLFAVVFTAMEVVATEKRGNTSYGVATPTVDPENIFETVGVRTIQSSPYGVFKIYEDKYVDGAWARSAVLFGHVMFDGYSQSVRWL